MEVAQVSRQTCLSLRAFGDLLTTNNVKSLFVKRSTVLFCLSALFLIYGCGSQQKDIPPGQWFDLFNGKNLNGWQRLNGNAEFEVIDGAIVGTSKRGAKTTFLATQRIFSDFALEFEFQIDNFLNSGVQIRSNSTDYQNGNVHGYQVEIDPSDRAWSGGIYDQSRRGWLFPMELNPNGGQAFKKDEWNKVYVEAVGDEIKTWLNGVPAAYLIDDMTGEGFIALQIHSIDRPELVGREIRWRNIRVKTLPIERKEDDFPHVNNLIPNYLSEAEQAKGWSSLFDGKNTNLWRGAHAETFPEKGWTVDDGELRVEESGGGEARHGGDIVTKATFGAFEFSLDFKLTPGANSGIKYFVTEAYNQTEGSAIGLEYQLLDDAKHPDAKNGRDGNRTLASLYDLITAEKQERFVKPPGEWNHARIVVDKNNHVTHWLNYVKVLEYRRGSRSFRDLVKISKYKDWKDFGEAEEGHILLQDHGNAVSFRNIKVRKLL